MKWRRRIESKGMEKLLQATIEAAICKGLIKPVDTRRVNVDTTVQEKAVAFPTDARLYQKMRRALVRAARGRGIGLRQSYERPGKKALLMQGRYSHARQMRRAARQTRKLKTYLGRVYRDIGRKAVDMDEALKSPMATTERLLNQQRHDKQKLYSIHEPAVECMAKGKVHKRYEFGNKVSVVSTSKSNWIVGTQALHGNPYDGHTLEGELKQMQRLVGKMPKEAYCDKGYRGADKSVEGVEVHLPKKRKNMTRSLRRWLKRRSAIEPVIGHLKGGNRMDRNYPKGTEGDKMNALPAACGYNLRKLIRAFFLPIIRGLFEAVFSVAREQSTCRLTLSA